MYAIEHPASIPDIRDSFSGFCGTFLEQRGSCLVESYSHNEDLCVPLQPASLQVLSFFMPLLLSMNLTPSSLRTTHLRASCYNNNCNSLCQARFCSETLNVSLSLVYFFPWLSRPWFLQPCHVPCM